MHDPKTLPSDSHAPHASESSSSETPLVPGMPRSSSDAEAVLQRQLNHLAEVWRHLTELHQQGAHSLAVYLENQELRDALDTDLRKTLLEMGSFVFEWHRQGGQVSLDDDSPRSGVGTNGSARLYGSRPTEPVRPASYGQPREPSTGGSVRHVVRVPGNNELPPRPASAAGGRLDGPPRKEDYAEMARVFTEVKAEVGSPPSSITTMNELMTELGMIDRVTSGDRLDRWAQLPDEIQRALTGYVAARLRHLQDELTFDLAEVVANEDRVGQMFRRLSQHMERHRPGFVNGLALAHTPEGESWKDDVERFQRELQYLAEKYFADSFISPEEEANTDDDAPDSEATTAPGGHATGPADVLPEGWPWREKIRSSRILMIGGEPRREALEQIQEAFGPRDLDWPDIETDQDDHEVASCARRIQQGSFDVVVLLTESLAHNVYELIHDACQTADRPVDIIYLDHEFGVGPIRQGIENFLQP